MPLLSHWAAIIASAAPGHDWRNVSTLHQARRCRCRTRWRSPLCSRYRIPVFSAVS